MTVAKAEAWPARKSATSSVSVAPCGAAIGTIILSDTLKCRPDYRRCAALAKGSRVRAPSLDATGEKVFLRAIRKRPGQRRHGRLRLPRYVSPRRGYHPLSQAYRRLRGCRGIRRRAHGQGRARGADPAGGGGDGRLPAPAASRPSGAIA